LSKSHILEILALEVFNSEEYMEEETIIDDEFTLNYPNENLIFISKESLHKITNPIFEWGTFGQNDTICYEPIKKVLDFDQNNLFQFDIAETEKIKININSDISVFDNNFLLAEDMSDNDIESRCGE